MSEHESVNVAPPALELPWGSRVDVELFRTWDAGELAEPAGALDFLINGVWARGTYGQLAGEAKTLKSHLALAMTLAITSGAPLFGCFEVPQPAPVLYYCGEGGQRPFRRRLQRMAAAVGVDLRVLPLRATFDVADISSPRFRSSLDRDLREHRPALTVIDPYYAFHGAGRASSNLHDEGALLTALSGQCAEYDCGLLIVNHFNKSGVGTGLSRITQAGGSEWSDSWVLVSHLHDPWVEEGEFELRLEIGSRQWGGRTLEMDARLGAFNHDTGAHDGQPHFRVRGVHA
jgi:RecA-family ATPase